MILPTPESLILLGVMKMTELQMRKIESFVLYLLMHKLWPEILTTIVYHTKNFMIAVFQVT